MPLYEYECSQCKKKTELVQKFSDPPAEMCPHCGKKGLVKALSLPSFQLKGTGWYKTDYKKSGETASKSDDSKKPIKSED